ncbi:hypothetical protein IGB42_01284 [Andreprevotia sp. IGB-42]|uniref:hypothetical protein n=1 Tax=Andreprevotia sp. IGB-42 TaxID=2497473 RepID=UPI00135ABD6F|nr:hypothetical protein [Andreprevotia sp. IGB-42]KAF0814383.1 hypothetical protein IGB42_01284 [Andreprevotia sp. IGB-42]
MKSLFTLILSAAALALLSGCAATPAAPKPVRVQAAEAAVLAANRASQAGAYADATAFWREAGVAYASIDDWAGQGEAALGLAQSLVRSGERDEAVRILSGLRGDTLYPAMVRARAAYQQALLQVATPDVATQSLAEARALCGVACPWRSRFDNLAARLAMQAGAYPQAAALLAGVLASDDLPQGERAHALRLSAELALQGGDLARARQYIDAAIAIDRQLAEPAYLIDDYAFLRRYAGAAGDDVLAGEAGRRLQSLCAASPDAAACRAD